MLPVTTYQQPRKKKACYQPWETLPRKRTGTNSSLLEAPMIPLSGMLNGLSSNPLFSLSSLLLHHHHLLLLLLHRLLPRRNYRFSSQVAATRAFRSTSTMPAFTTLPTSISLRLSSPTCSAEMSEIALSCGGVSWTSLQCSLLTGHLMWSWIRGDWMH